MRNITVIPDQWVILKLPNNVYKVFGVGLGGYLSGDYWKLNSGIKLVEQDDNYYYFHGYSGSCYQCRKTYYGITFSYGLSILDKLITQSNNTLVLMDNVDDWTTVID